MKRGRPPLPKPPLPSFLKDFFEGMFAERGASLNTLESYERDIRDFMAFLQNVQVEDATQVHIQSYMAHLRTHAMSEATQARRLSCLRRVYQFLMIHGYCSQDPTSGILSPKHVKDFASVLSEEGVLTLLQAAHRGEGPDNVRLAALLELLYATGMRVSELAALPMTALTTLNNAQPYIIVKGKGCKERIVPLHAQAMRALARYLAIRDDFCTHNTSPWVFPSISKTGHLTRQRVGQLLKELAVLAGLSPALLSPHKLRHAFATHLLKRGAPIINVQKLLGHADLSTTQLYTHITHKDLQTFVQRYHPMADKKAR